MRPIYARPIIEEECKTLHAELKSSQEVLVRRSHIILMSADEGLKAQAIAKHVGYSDETGVKSSRVQCWGSGGNLSQVERPPR